MSRRSFYIAGFLVLVALVLLWRRGGESDAGETSAGGEVAASEPGTSNPGDTGTGPILPPARLRATGDSPAEQAAGRISGLVTDVETGDPVPWVDVIFKSREAESAVSSGESGRYETTLPAGQYEVRAIGDGVIGKAVPTVRIGGVADVSRDISVVRLATIRGNVVSARGSAVPGAEVLLRHDTKHGAAFPNQGEVGVGMSAGDGSFELHVPPGTADLSATVGQTTVFASVSDVPSGGEIADVTIVLDRRGTIRGHVGLPGGAPAANSEVILAYRRTGTSQFDRRTTRADSAGAYVFEDLAPMDYVVEAILAGHAPSAPAQVALSADALAADVELKLTAPASLSGRVVDAEGNPVGNAQVAQVWMGSKQRFAKIETYSSGEFSFSMVGPGPHILRARKEGYADVKLRGVMAPKSDITLTLIASGGLEGRIAGEEDKPVQLFTVQVTDKRKRPVKTERFRTRDGSFQLYPLNPGTYNVVISARGFAPRTLEAVVVPSSGYGDASTVLVPES